MSMSTRVKYNRLPFIINKTKKNYNSVSKQTKSKRATDIPLRKEGRKGTLDNVFAPKIKMK